MASVLEALHRAAREERAARQAAEEALAERDRLIKQAREEGHPVVVIGEVVGISRQQAHRIATSNETLS